jgi:hypothetical protein
MLLDLQRKDNQGVQLFISRIKALPRNFWFILLGALAAQATLIWFGTASWDPFGDVRYVYSALILLYWVCQPIKQFKKTTLLKID